MMSIKHSAGCKGLRLSVFSVFVLCGSVDCGNDITTD